MQLDSSDRERGEKVRLAENLVRLHTGSAAHLWMEPAGLKVTHSAEKRETDQVVLSSLIHPAVKIDARPAPPRESEGKRARNWDL